jgi:hypothetical protein
MPVFECPDCNSYVSIHKNAPDQECHACHRKVKVSWQKKINYDGHPIGFVHYKEDRVTMQADVFLDLQTLIASRSQINVNEGRGSVVS